MKKMLLDHRLLENFCWPLLLATVGLCICGLLNLYSVSSHSVFTEEWSWFVRQGLYLCLAFIGFAFALLIDYQYLKRIVWPLYGLSVLLLAAVFVVGTNVNGATRWLDLGLFRFQPSESMKVVAVVALAAWFARRDMTAGLGFKDLLVPILIVFVPFVLIHRQPDLGTALHLLATCVPMFLIFRFRSHLIVAISLGAVLLAGLTAALMASGSWTVLLEKGIIKNHQVERIQAYFDPDVDPSGKSWQVIQARNAIGGGQFLGRGFMEGPQHKNGFLPEAETDFAFAALAEEWGFVGCMVVLSLFVCLLCHCLTLARRSKDRFGSLIVLGLTSLLFWQVIINVGMVTGLLPVVGIPLPFISYGGTSLVVTIVAVGTILNIGMRRYMFQDTPVQENPYVWQQDDEEELVDAPILVTVPVRRLTVDTPFNPGLHPSHRLPHTRPWAKYLRKSSRSYGRWSYGGEMEMKD